MGTSAPALAKARQGEPLTGAEALSLAACDDIRALADIAAAQRNLGFHNVVTYSRKVFIPLTPPVPGRVPLLHFRAGAAPHQSTLHALGGGA